MKTLTAEMKAELAAKRQAAEANAKLRIGKPEPKFIAPNKPVKVIPEAKTDYYRGMNPVSRAFEVYELEVNNY